VSLLFDSLAFETHLFLSVLHGLLIFCTLEQCFADASSFYFLLLIADHAFESTFDGHKLVCPPVLDGEVYKFELCLLSLNSIFPDLENMCGWVGVEPLHVISKEFVSLSPQLFVHVLDFFQYCFCLELAFSNYFVLAIDDLSLLLYFLIEPPLMHPQSVLFPILEQILSVPLLKLHQN
jgi:hypothetical protein